MSEDTAYVRVALVGLGGVCEGVHYSGFERIPGVEICAICDPDSGLLNRRCQEWSIDAAYETIDELLCDSAPDAVVVATPNVYHKPLILAALERGCHVLCEKPLALDLAETEELCAAATAAGVRHMVAFTYRFVPAMTYLHHLVATGELGEIRHARFQRLQDWGELAIGWRQYAAQAGTGELADMGIHRIDFAQSLLGPIRSVCGGMKQLVPRDRTVDGAPCPPQDVEDWIAWIAEFDSGATGVFEMGKLSKGQGPAGDHDLAELNGTKGSGAYRLHAPNEVLVGGRGEPYVARPVPPEFLVRPGSPRDPAVGDPVQTFRWDQAWEFVSAIREARECVPSFHDAVRAQAVADAIVQAASERRWVDVFG